MGDEEDPWGFDEGGDSAQAPTEATTDNAAPQSGPQSAGNVSVERIQTPAQEIEGQQVLEGETEYAAPPPPPPEDDGYRKPVQLYRHWVRPKFLQYKYMYNYRTNYYDDVIDYLDKKQVGVKREIPRPQTWAERVLRTNSCSGKGTDAYTASSKSDRHLVQTLAASIRTYNYHTKAYLNQKYAHVL